MLLRPKAPRMAERLVEGIFHALDEQTVTVPGTKAAALIVPSLAGSLTAVLDQRKLLAGRIEELLEDHPLSKVLTSMLSVGIRTGARILIEVGDGSTFPTAGHLAAYAGLAPATRSSGSSIRGEQPSRRGNKQLKRPSPSPRSPPWATQPPGPTTTRRSPRASTTPRPCSISPAAGPTSCSRCSATKPSTTPGPSHQADPHRARRTPGSPIRRDSRSRQGDYRRRTDACPPPLIAAHALHRSCQAECQTAPARHPPP